jgi:G:T/U-mismatch repair DNA glycosylase
MNYILLVSVFLITALAYFLYSQNKIYKLIAINSEYSQELQATKEAVEALRASTARQARLLQDVSRQRQEAEDLRDSALRALETNDLRAISERKPELVETRINRGTKDVFKEIERVSRQ